MASPTTTACQPRSTGGLPMASRERSTTTTAILWMMFPTAGCLNIIWPTLPIHSGYKLIRTNLKRLNYANSDYDYRHSLSANYFYDMPFKSSNQYLNMAIGGWSLAGTFFYKSGEPYSVYNSTARTSNLINSERWRRPGRLLGWFHKLR